MGRPVNLKVSDSKDTHDPPAGRPRRRRLDTEMVTRGLAETREQARRLILAGLVSVAGSNRIKPGTPIAPDADIRVAARERYVSRGGLKLEAALSAFGLDPTGWVCADIGASTGGFTDCLLQHGAARVYAVDVGRSQIHPRLRDDNRVKIIEHCNARNLTADILPEPADLIVVDVSFISVTKILPSLAAIARLGTHAIILVKPQFEATRAEVSRGRGVIRDDTIRLRALRTALDAALKAQWLPRRALPCPVEGGSGNREWLLLLRRDTHPPALTLEQWLEMITEPAPCPPGGGALGVDAIHDPPCNSGVNDSQPSTATDTPEAPATQ